MRIRFLSFSCLIVVLAALVAFAQNAPSDTQSAPSSTPASTPAPAPAPAAAPAAAAPAPLPMPSMSGPLATAVPHEISFGSETSPTKLEVTGILSGMVWSEGNHVPGDNSTHYDLSNAQIFVQKTTGWWQFYLQGGAYNLPAIGVPFLSTVDTIKNVYGPFPQGYLELVKKTFDVKIGALPTLIGAEYTFSFQNMNIERGLLWGQENAVNRGIQIDDTYKKLALSLSLNDGFYSNRYTWVSGSATYTFNAANSLIFVAGGNAGAYAKNTLATPLFLNNSSIYNLIYTYSKGNWVVQPYFQYTDVPTNASVGITQGTSTKGGALLVTRNFKHGFSLAPRVEYIKSSGGATAANVLYGPGSGAFSFTVTPTYKTGAFFLRGDLAIVHATSMTAGAGFGTAGLNATQPRGVIEAGFMF